MRSIYRRRATSRVTQTGQIWYRVTRRCYCSWDGFIPRKGCATWCALGLRLGGNGQRALKKLFDMPELERRAMGEKGRRLVEEQFTWPVVAASMRSVYEWVLCRGPMPACVASN